MTQEVNETWDDANPSIPKTMQYAGSEEFIRAQFESYVIGLISSVKYHNYVTANAPGIYASAEGDPALDFGLEWVEAWMLTENYRMWDSHTDTNLFAVSEPRHPCAGGLTIDDVQRRIADQVKELHIDERLAQGRDILGRNLAAGREKASTMLNKLYSDMEYLREAQRRRAEEAVAQGQGQNGNNNGTYPAQQTVQSRAGAYMSSWATWAGEKRKTGGWGAGWGRKQKSENTTSMPTSPIDRDYQMISPPSSRTMSSEENDRTSRPHTQASFSESILSGDSSDRPDTASSVADNTPLTEKRPARRATQNGHGPNTNNDGFQTENLIGAKQRPDSTC